MRCCTPDRMMCRRSESQTAIRLRLHASAISSGSPALRILLSPDLMSRRWPLWMRSLWHVPLCNRSGRSRCCAARIRIRDRAGIHRPGPENPALRMRRRTCLIPLAGPRSRYEMLANFQSDRTCSKPRSSQTMDQKRSTEDAMTRTITWNEGTTRIALTRFRAIGLHRPLMLLVALTLTSGLLAQTASTGALGGTVTDSSGAVVGGASVKITNEMTGEDRTLDTHRDGSFLAPLLLPATYRIEAASKGFKTLVRTGVAVFVTEKQDLHLVLEVGTATQTVEVQAEGAVLKTQESALGNVTEGQSVRDLPLVNRNYTQIIGLSPGVVTDVNNASDLGRGNSGMNAADGGFSSHGGATNDNNYQMNGTQVNDLMAAGSFSGGVPIPNPDAIQEFKVQTGQYDASYGRNAVANVDLITKRGTNVVHGTLFEFVRNDVFNANDYFLNRAGQPRAGLRQNQFVFELGGPMVMY